MSQDNDFVWLFRGRNGNPECIKTWLYDDLTIKTVRDTAQEHMEAHHN